MMSDRHGEETQGYGSAAQRALTDVAQFNFQREMMSDLRTWRQSCTSDGGANANPGRDASPDVHGLDAV